MRQFYLINIAVFFSFILIFSPVALANGLAFFKEITKLTGSEAENEYQHIIDVSTQWDILECPIELIERQWQGPESVRIGTQFFLQIIKESSNAKPDYKYINDECLKILTSYRERDIIGTVDSRVISNIEILDIISAFSMYNSLKEKALIKIIVDNLNSKTLCQMSRVSVNLSFMIGGGIGSMQMNCFTPFGRRFKLSGPSIALGLGFGASVVLPKSHKKNQSTYKFKLYKSSLNSMKYTHHTSKLISIIAGLAHESDRPHWASEDRSGEMIHKNNWNPVIGVHFAIDDVYNYLKYKKQSPLYFKFINSGILD